MKIQWMLDEDVLKMILSLSQINIIRLDSGSTDQPGIRNDLMISFGIFLLNSRIVMRIISLIYTALD